MNSQYSILFRVNFRHAYFADDILDCFSVKPTLDTERFLLNHGLLFKARYDGFTIAFESYKNGMQYSAESILASDQALVFTVSLKDALFFNYTGVEAGNIATSVFHFHNTEETGTSSLHVSDYAGSADLVPAKEMSYQFFTKPFALIELQLNKITTEEYVIRFKEKSTYWRYLLVSDHLRELHNPAVLNGSVVFKGPVEIELPNKKRALAFESDSPLSIRQRSDKTFQLVENFDSDSNKGKMVIKALPQPDINLVSRLNAAEVKEYSEIMI